MARSIVTYDLTSDYPLRDQVKQHLVDNGFNECDSFPDGTSWKLPETTLLYDADMKTTKENFYGLIEDLFDDHGIPFEKPKRVYISGISGPSHLRRRDPCDD